MREKLEHRRRFRTAATTGNKLLLMLLKRNPRSGPSLLGGNGSPSASNMSSNSSRSLYIVLLFGLFFAGMLLVQMITVESSGDPSFAFDDPSESGDQAFKTWSSSVAILNRFKFGSSEADVPPRLLGRNELPEKVIASTRRSVAGKQFKVSTVASSGDGELKRKSFLAAAKQLQTIKSSSPLLPLIAGNYTSEFAIKDTWQPVQGTKDKFFVYSAYYDARHPKYKYIRVIGATRTRNSEKVICRLDYGLQGKQQSPPLRPIMVNAVNKVIRENWNLRFSAYFILCLIANHPVPSSVQIMLKSNLSLPASNHLLVHNRPELVEKKLLQRPISSSLSWMKSNEKAAKEPARQFSMASNSFAVCVKPMHYDYNKVLNLIEFLELNRQLGVGHFVLYNHTVGKEASCLLSDYVRKGIVTILPWQLNIASQKDIRTEGLFAALNDCLYRTMYSFRYVLMIDFDEFIIPNQDASLPELVGRLSKLNNNAARAGAYSFQNGFFYLQWPDDGEVGEGNGSLAVPANAEKDALKLLTLSKTRRKAKLHIHKQRSKCLVRPDQVVEMGNHFVWEFVAGKAMINVAPRFAFLHHYRICEFGGDDCVHASSVVDRRVPEAWGRQLKSEVSTRLAAFNQTCKAD